MYGDVDVWTCVAVLFVLTKSWRNQVLCGFPGRWHIWCCGHPWGLCSCPVWCTLDAQTLLTYQAVIATDPFWGLQGSAGFLWACVDRPTVRCTLDCGDPPAAAADPFWSLRASSGVCRTDRKTDCGCTAVVPSPRCGTVCCGTVCCGTVTRSVTDPFWRLQDSSGPCVARPLL